jgi:hypothetical protein
MIESSFMPVEGRGGALKDSATIGEGNAYSEPEKLLSGVLSSFKA